jgi:hypothetical protein
LTVTSTPLNVRDWSPSFLDVVTKLSGVGLILALNRLSTV